MPVTTQRLCKVDDVAPGTKLPPQLTLLGEGHGGTEDHSQGEEKRPEETAPTRTIALHAQQSPPRATCRATGDLAVMSGAGKSRC